MLLLDAMEDAPVLYAVLTAAEHLHHSDLRKHLTKLRRSLKRRWPDVRWAVIREYQRRGALHVNLMVKGVPKEDRDDFHAAWTSLWCSRVDAQEVAQYTGVIGDEIALTKYITLHFMKESQAPGIGWKGHRYSATLDYLVRPASVMREEARGSLRRKRLRFRLAAERTDELHRRLASAIDLEDHVTAGNVYRELIAGTDPSPDELATALAETEATTWELRHHEPDTWLPRNRRRGAQRELGGGGAGHPTNHPHDLPAAA
jgi:hypothetical protein